MRVERETFSSTQRTSRDVFINITLITPNWCGILKVRQAAEQNLLLSSKSTKKLLDLYLIFSELIFFSVCIAIRLSMPTQIFAQQLVLMYKDCIGIFFRGKVPFAVSWGHMVSAPFNGSKGQY